MWQDRLTAETCARLKGDGAEPLVSAKTGLLLDPYFSATKVAWILDNVPGARARAERGELAFGTIDCFLLWRLTGGAVHATGVTNASRTMLMNLSTLDWDVALAAYQAVRPQHCRRVLTTARSWGALWHLTGEERLWRNEVMRSRDVHDYSFGDWLYRPTALTPVQEPAMFAPA